MITTIIVVGFVLLMIDLALCMNKKEKAAAVKEADTFQPVSQHQLYLNLKIVNIIVEEDDLFFIYEEIPAHY